MKEAIRILLVSWLIFSFVYIGLEIKNWLYPDELKENSQFVATILGLIDKYYIDEVKLREIVYPAIKEMVSRLDSHSYFLTPEETKADKEKDIQRYAGIGVQIGFCQSWQELEKLIRAENFDINKAPIEIKKVFDGSPAFKAGLMPGDEIIAVDNVPIREIGAKEIAEIIPIERRIVAKVLETAKKIQGPAGTSVMLAIKRKGLAKPKVFTLIREGIQIKNVEWKIISTAEKKIGYLEIRGFIAQSTAEEVMKAIVEFTDNGVGGVIIDLRDNLGGFVNTCVDVLEFFLPPNTLVISAKGKIGEFKYNTRRTYPNCRSLPIVVLINGASASGSEVVVGALRDYKKAILIGEKTFGKGTAQARWKFPDGSVLTLTIFKYFLPNGECIHEKGISPDIEIRTDFDVPIITKAIEVLMNWDTYKEKFLK